LNFLAHLYLSGKNEPLLVGNFIADHIRGYDWKKYPTEIQKGILLHRFIDEFTDHHQQVELTKLLLRNTFHKYTPVISDIYYDHFLAKHWFKFSKEPLPTFSSRVYSLLHQYETFLPEKTKRMLIYMEADNWLTHYATLDGMNQALSGMGRRARFENNMHEAGKFLSDHYDAIEKHFFEFFPELENAVQLKILDIHVGIS
jgi:acyl carrier protein phosphodiesterase